VFETNVSGRNNIWGALSLNAPRGYEPLCMLHGLLQDDIMGVATE